MCMGLLISDGSHRYLTEIVIPSHHQSGKYKIIHFLNPDIEGFVMNFQGVCTEMGEYLPEGRRMEIVLITENSIYIGRAKGCKISGIF